MLNSIRRLFFFLSLLLVFVGCNQAKKPLVKSPNILFAIMDDATYKHMSAYGCTWVHTPNFDRVANNGILFNRAYTPNAKCGPSRANILTGRNSWQLEEAGNHWAYFPTKFKVFTEVLAENGYKVGYTGKGWAPGRAFNEDGTKRDLLVQSYNENVLSPPTSGISITDYAENFNEFLSEKGEEPFFFWYGGWEPHRSYEYGSGIAKGNKKLNDIEDSEIFEFWPKNDSIRTDLLDYAYEIEYFDKQLGKMIDKLEAAGELSNTIIVVTSDNGMPFPRVKGQEYEYSNHLPLAIMWQEGIEYKGRQIDDVVSFIDFAPTFLELAGVDVNDTGMKPLTGKSLGDIFYAREEGIIDSTRNTVLIGKERHDVGRPDDQGYPIRGIIKDNFLYLHNFKTDRWPAGNPETGYLNVDGGATKTVILNQIEDGSLTEYWKLSFGKRPQEEFYDLSKDPGCIENLVSNTDYNSSKERLKAELFDRLKQQGDPRVSGQGDVFDSYKYADKRGVHFYSRYMEGDSSLVWSWVNDSDFQNLDSLKASSEQVKINE
ncbi:sulfatase [Zhouia amylolytica]|uniref:sulfatase family protein n=1 Tax=Zhouia amylolytica TaxID=376730 RepID=UPI0020CC0BC3|nr:sulfatase [Zhouia amylolytica]MCQ0110051.1 sulfatase [Zhouia amylolytica]